MSQRINVGHLRLERQGRSYVCEDSASFRVVVEPCSGRYRGFAQGKPWMVTFWPQGGTGYVEFVQSLHSNSIRAGLKKAKFRAQRDLEGLRGSLKSLGNAF